MRRADLRDTVPDWIDHLLCRWARWMRDDSDCHKLGFRRASAGFGDGGSLKSFEDLEDSVITWQIRVSDSIITALPVDQRVAINHVYVAAVWSNARRPIEVAFDEAVTNFGTAARKRGLE